MLERYIVIKVSGNLFDLANEVNTVLARCGDDWSPVGGPISLPDYRWVQAIARKGADADHS